MKTTCVALWLVSLAAVAAAQTSTPTQTPSQPTFRTGIDVVTVDVAVVDDRGQPVNDLRAPEFTVKIDGQPRRVVTADLVKFEYTPDPVMRPRPRREERFETAYTTNITQPEGRMIMIAVDQMNIRPGAARPVLDSAARFLDRLNPADRVAFVSFPEPGVVVDFTGDHQRVKLAMQKVIGAQSHSTSRRNIGLVEAIAIAQRGDDRRLQDVLNRECRGLVDLALQQCTRDVVDESNAIMFTTRRDAEASLRGLRQWLQYLAETEGQKTLVLLSEGLVTDSPADLEDVVRAAMRGRIAVNVLLMDVPRADATVGPLPPTFTEDRELQTRGLNDLTALSRGALYQVVGTADRAFDRLASEISAYYLLSVEQIPSDTDGRDHRIDIAVGRSRVTLRSRQAFVMDSAGRVKSPEESLVESLRSPLGVTGVPLRVSTFVYQDPQADGKVRLMVAADVGQPGDPPAPYTMGYIVVDNEGRVVASKSEKLTLSPQEGRPAAALSYLGAVTLDPGVYDFRLGAVDARGRRGSVVREVSAWKMAGEEFTFADLVVNHAAGAVAGLRPDVEPHVDPDGVAAYVELYASSEDVFKDVVVDFEIADDADAQALVTTPSVMLTKAAKQTWRVAQGYIGAEPLPAGRYVARARIRRADKTVASLTRPFVLETAAAAKGGPMLIPSAFARASTFDRAVLLQPTLVAGYLDTVAARGPSLKSAVTEARAGRYGAAALEALSAGDQQAAAFLKGLDLYGKGQLEQAATQLAIAAGPRREFFPAALLLGGCFAASGKDRDAAGIWQLSLGTEARPVLAYRLLADARLRGGQPEAVAAILKPAYAAAPTDDDIGRRLVSAYLLTGSYGDALPVLESYLTRNPTDPDALFAAVLAKYQLTLAAGNTLTAAEQTTLRRYASAYKGPQAALIARYLTAMGVGR
jgi:VWFA-related protein